VRQRGDAVYISDLDPERDGPPPPEAVDAAVVCAPGGAATAVAAVKPGGTVLVFADPGALAVGRVYRDEIELVGSRSATPRHLEQAVRLLGELELPAATVLPLERFDEGLELYRRRQALKLVFTP
jgi:threonine dehydrogenase-like Zn-dependent dehydrogenase